MLTVSWLQNAAEAEEYNEAWMQDFVQKLSAFDQRMNTAVIDSGILKHIPKDALGRAGESHIVSASHAAQG